MFCQRNGITYLLPPSNCLLLVSRDTKERTFILALGWRRHRAICRMDPLLGKGPYPLTGEEVAFTALWSLNMLCLDELYTPMANRTSAMFLLRVTIFLAPLGSSADALPCHMQTKLCWPCSRFKGETTASASCMFRGLRDDEPPTAVQRGTAQVKGSQ